MGIIKWLLAVLDITMEKIWKKLEERIGKEKERESENAAGCEILPRGGWKKCRVSSDQ